MLSFSVDMQPIGKQRPRFRRGAPKPHTPHKTLLAERTIGQAATAAGARLAEGAVKLFVVVVHPMPKRWAQARKTQMDGAPCTATPDLDNTIKTISDALNGVAYSDDRQIIAIEGLKIWGETGRIDIRLQAVEEAA